MGIRSGSTSNNPCPENVVYGWYRGGAGQKYTAPVTIYLNKKLLPRLRCNDLVAQYIVQHVLVHKSGHWVRITGLLNRREPPDSDNPQFSLAGQADENDNTAEEEAGEMAELSFFGGNLSQTTPLGSTNGLLLHIRGEKHRYGYAQLVHDLPEACMLSHINRSTIDIIKAEELGRRRYIVLVLKLTLDSPEFPDNWKSPVPSSLEQVASVVNSSKLFVFITLSKKSLLYPPVTTLI